MMRKRRFTGRRPGWTFWVISFRRSRRRRGRAGRPSPPPSKRCGRRAGGAAARRTAGGRHRPHQGPAGPEREARMATLYIKEQGARLRKEQERLVVMRGEERLVDVPAIKVDRVVVMGRGVQVSTAALTFLAQRGTPVIFT